MGSPEKNIIQLAQGAFAASGVKGLIKQIGFHSYLVNGGYSHPLPSPLLIPLHPPTTFQRSLPLVPHGNVRRATVSALLQNLQRYLPSQHAVELETVKQIRARTVHAHTHTHSGYLGSEIINANRAAADREGGERQTQGQVRSNKQSRERKYAKRGGNMSAPAQNIYNSFVCVQYISHESFRLDSLFIVHQLIQMITHAGNGAACARDKQKHAMEEIRGQIRERT